jgi:hypothetical protein
VITSTTWASAAISQKVSGAAGYASAPCSTSDRVWIA